MGNLTEQVSWSVSKFKTRLNFFSTKDIDFTQEVSKGKITKTLSFLSAVSKMKSLLSKTNEIPFPPRTR